MKYQIYDNNIKVELNSEEQLLEIIDELYYVKTATTMELSFTDYDTALDVNSRYVRCYLSFNSVEEAARFCFKLMHINQMYL